MQSNRFSGEESSFRPGPADSSLYALLALRNDNIRPESRFPPMLQTNAGSFRIVRSLSSTCGEQVRDDMLNGSPMEVETRGTINSILTGQRRVNKDTSFSLTLRILFSEFLDFW